MLRTATTGAVVVTVSKDGARVGREGGCGRRGKVGVDRFLLICWAREVVGEAAARRKLRDGALVIFRRATCERRCSDGRHVRTLLDEG